MNLEKSESRLSKIKNFESETETEAEKQKENLFSYTKQKMKSKIKDINILLCKEIKKIQKQIDKGIFQKLDEIIENKVL